MRILISFLNDVAVSIFGSVLAASFCNALYMRRNKRIFGLAIVCFMLLQIGIYSIRDAEFLRQFADRPGKSQIQFGIIPALYYVFDYLTVVYTDILTGGSPVVVEFMPLVCCAGYLVFLLYYAGEEQKRLRLLQIRNSLDIQLKQSVREISALRESQELARRYRHDLRHHLQFISAYMENGREEQAKEYIREICQEIEAQKVVCYCENEAVNLILSSFAGRALKEGIGMEINGVLPETLPISERDMCVLLSNALENAVHACQAVVAEKRAAVISVRFYEQDGRFFYRR